MLQTATPATTPGTPTFAGLLAALATPATRRAAPVDLDSLEDDVATLSYERALNAHARYRVPQGSDHSLTQPPVASGLRIFEARPAPPEPELSAAAQPAAEELTAAEAPAFDRELPQPVDLQSAPSPSRSLLQRDLKSSSITIRLSSAEYDQLRRRAAEAGLTVSAYLRSCTFEAESLRAMVKDTLSQIRSETAGDDRGSASSPVSLWRGWLRRLWPSAAVKSRASRSPGNLSHARFTG